jgi:hypothetical protein
MRVKLPAVKQHASLVANINRVSFFAVSRLFGSRPTADVQSAERLSGPSIDDPSPD